MYEEKVIWERKSKYIKLKYKWYGKFKLRVVIVIG